MTSTHGTDGCILEAVGVISPLGRGLDVTSRGLLAGAQKGFVSRDDLVPEAGLLYGVAPDGLPPVPEALASYDCRTNRLLLAALEEIATPVKGALERFGPARLGVVLGTSTSGMERGESAFREAAGALLPGWFELRMIELGSPAEFLARAAGAQGPRQVISTACSSSANALASARSLLELGICDAVLAGGADSLCQLTARGFHSLGAVSPGLTNPMSRRRDGLTLGEGAALFLLTRGREGVRLLGAAGSMDAHHMSAPDPEGKGAEAALRAALADADTAPEEVAYLNLHGTGTVQNDAMESAAVDRVFGNDTPCSSTKPLVGHTLAAAGAIEAAFCWLVLQGAREGRMRLPPHRFDGRYDETLPPLRLVGEAESVPVGPRIRIASSSFGFGGSNCVLVLGTDSAC